MARKAYVSSDMAHDEKLIDVAAECPEAALLWPWLITHFDDWGRAEANPKRIKAQLFPMNDLVTPELIDKAISLFHQYGLLTHYEVDGKRYIAIEPEKWFKYQTHIHKSKRENDQSRFPAPPVADTRESSRHSASPRENRRGIAPSTLPPYHPSPTPSPPPNPPTGDEEDGDDVATDDQERLAEVVAHYRERIGLLSPMMFQTLGDWLKDGIAPQVVVAAIDETAAARDDGRIKHSIDGWLKTVVRDWYNRGIRTAKDLAARARADPRSPEYDPIAVIRAKVAEWEREYQQGGDGSDERAGRARAG